MFRNRNIITPIITVCAVFLAVVQYNSLRRTTRLTRTAILYPGQSPWNHILENADQRSFLELTGFNRGTFTLLLHVLFPDPIIQQFGRPRLIDEKGQLGLYLLFVNSRMTYNNLCLIFGCTGTMFSHRNRDDETCISNAQGQSCCSVHFPTTAREKRSLARLVQRREPGVRDVISFTDGVSIPVQCASDINRQTTDYNGYHHDTMCNNVFCFAPTGKI